MTITIKGRVVTKSVKEDERGTGGGAAAPAGLRAVGAFRTPVSAKGEPAKVGTGTKANAVGERAAAPAVVTRRVVTDVRRDGTFTLTLDDPAFELKATDAQVTIVGPATARPVHVHLCVPARSTRPATRCPLACSSCCGASLMALPVRPDLPGRVLGWSPCPRP
jgi:hypothetical protein